MPKEVLRSGATAQPAAPAAAKPTAPAAPAPAPAAAANPHAAHLDEMEKRLKAMNLDPQIVQAALAAERKKLEGQAAPKAAAAPKSEAPAPAAAAPAAAKPPAPVKPPAEKPAEKPAPLPSDDEFAAQAAAAYEGGESAEDLPPEEPSQLPATTEGAEPASHADDDGVPSGTVVVHNHWSDASDGAISGPIDQSDFKTPQLKIVQGSGPLSKLFNQGTLIYMDQVIFEPPAPDKPGPPINFIPVKLQKYLRENLQRDPNAPADQQQRQPRNAATIEEVHRLGGTTEFTEAGGKRIKPTWGPAARVLLIVERPEGCTHEGFGIVLEIGGKVRYFAPAVMYVNGGQYRSFARPILDATSFILCEGTGKERKILLEKRVWQMQVRKEESGENMVFNPLLSMVNELTPPELRDVAKSLRG